MADETKTVAQLAAETKSAFDGRFQEITSRLDEVEQKSARRGSPRDVSLGESLGAALADDPRLAEFAGDRSMPGRLQVETKAITSLANSAAALAGQPFRDAPASMAQRTLSVRDLLPVI